MHEARAQAVSAAIGRAMLWIAALPIRIIAWVYQPDERDRAGIGDAAIMRDARERREAWDRLQRELAAQDRSRYASLSDGHRTEG